MSKKAMKQGLEALKYHTAQTRPIHQTNEAIKALEEALAKQEQHTLSSRVNDVRVHIEHGKQHDEAMKMLTAKQEQGEPVASEAYDMIDRFLRSNLCDSDYSDYSAALDAIYTHPQPAPPKAEQEQGEPVGEILLTNGDYKEVSWKKGKLPTVGTKLYTTPQQRTWVGLTDEEIATTADYFKDAYGFTQGVLWAEAKLKEKNTIIQTYSEKDKT